MTRRALIFAYLLSGSLVFGQLDSNSITVTASRSVTFQPDQIVFSVDVSSPLDTSLDDVIAALASSGTIAAPNDAAIRAIADTVWVAVHGIVSLKLTCPSFPQTPVDPLIATMLHTFFEGILKRSLHVRTDDHQGEGRH